MRSHLLLFLALIVFVSPLLAKKNVDVVFCIDTTDGMKGEIKALKKKVKAIAVAVDEADVQMGVVAYRDEGDEYRTKELALTSNAKEVRTFVKKLKAAGGGDSEDVRAALHKAIKDMKWRKGGRLVVLIGDAGPNKERKDNPSCSRLANKAKEKGIKILALACAEMNLDGIASWKRMAQISDGTYEQLPAAKGRRLIVPEDCGSNCDNCTIPCDAADGSHGGAAKKVKETASKALERAVTDQIRALIR